MKCQHVLFILLSYITKIPLVQLLYWFPPVCGIFYQISLDLFPRCMHTMYAYLIISLVATTAYIIGVEVPSWENLNFENKIDFFAITQYMHDWLLVYCTARVKMLRNMKLFFPQKICSMHSTVPDFSDLQLISLSVQFVWWEMSPKPLNIQPYRVHQQSVLDRHIEQLI